MDPNDTILHFLHHVERKEALPVYYIMSILAFRSLLHYCALFSRRWSEFTVLVTKDQMRIKHSISSKSPVAVLGISGGGLI